MAEGAAVIDIRVRAIMEGQVEQRLKDVEHAARKADAATRGMGAAAKSTESDFKKFGHTVQEEVFELNTRKAKRFVDMFLGGGLFGIGMSLASAGIQKLGEAAVKSFNDMTQYAHAATDEIDKVTEALIRGSRAEVIATRERTTRSYNEALAKLIDLQMEDIRLFGGDLAGNYTKRSNAIKEQTRVVDALYHAMGKLSARQAELPGEKNKTTAKAPGQTAREWGETMLMGFNADEVIAEFLAKQDRAQSMALENVRETELAQSRARNEAERIAFEERVIQQDAMIKARMDNEARVNAMVLDMAINTAGQFVGIWGDAFGQLVVNGQGSWNDIAKSMLGALGSMAMQMGSFLILAGAGFAALPGGFSGAGAIAAGAGLVALGGVLKALAGGKSQAGSPSASAGGGYASSYSPSRSSGGSYGGQQQGGGSTVIINIGGQPVSDKASIAKAVAEAVGEGRRLGYVPPAAQW